MHGLYGISDTKLTPKDTIFSQLELAMGGGLRIFQYRDKENSDNAIQDLVLELQNICRKNNVTFILNDRYTLAIKLQLDGLHLGKDEVKEYKSIRKDFKGIIGISCYNDLNLALHFQDLGANYVAFGAMFNSSIKPESKRCNIETLNKAKKILNIPICAIGGINASNVSILNSIDMIAVISSLWTKPKSDIKDSYNYIRYNAQNLIKSWKQ